MAVLSIWLGWLIAGRALGPLRTITNAAQDISATNLHRRLSLKGPNDELRQLGNTFDALLERLETAFDAQRRFVANASHELRTPLTYERALLEVALADPDASEATLREACTQVLAVGEQQERLIEALLTLSRSQRGLERRERVDLAAVATETLRTTQTNGFEIDASLAPALTNGDARLIERLVANLVDNAVKYNVPHGRVEIATSAATGHAVLTVANTGPLIPAGEVGRLFQPFQRLEPDRAAGTNGVGLGLSIVDAIATAHAASLRAEPRDGGGLLVQVSFP
jgi:signal transduction histidine kinase